jgi:hypothetical protein
MKKLNHFEPMNKRSLALLSKGPQLVEKVQHLLGFLLFLWYNKSGDENVGKES